jgi:hypothetical protein
MCNFQFLEVFLLINICVKSDMVQLMFNFFQSYLKFDSDIWTFKCTHVINNNKAQ